MSNTLDKYSNIIKNQIKNYNKKIESTEIGYVINVGDGIVQVSGLTNVMYNELIEFENNTYGIAFNLEADYVSVVALGHFENIKENSVVKRTNRVIDICVGDGLLNRVVDALGNPIDGKGPIKSTKKCPIERPAFGVMERQSVDTPLVTGILSIDSMFPIGKGQRELIIGDKQTGKTTIAIDTIINQKNKNVKCVYVAIGQKNSTIVQIKKTLEEYDAMKYTTIISSSASDLPSLKYIAPFAGITIAEEWMKNGEDVLIVYDDLSKHAIAYRTLSLLLRRPPGREAYPGDVFYLHSRLLERSGKVNKENGGGSITALPIIETQAGDISAYIPTNVISITDGQLFMMSSLFNSGQRPAIDAGLSVSRVGSAAQIKSIKNVASSLKLELAQYRELNAFSQFGSDLDATTKEILDHGKKVMEILKQPQHVQYSQEIEALFLFSIKEKIIKWIPYEYIGEYIKSLMKYFNKDNNVVKELKNKKDIDASLKKAIFTEFDKLLKQIISNIKDYPYEYKGLND